MNPLELPQPYLLFIGDVTEPRFAKTALGLRDWAPERCVGQVRTSREAVSLDLPELSFSEAHRRGARAVVIGAAPIGGAISPQWIAYLVEALDAGLDLISGMHTKLAEIPALASAAARNERRLYDVRTPPDRLPTGNGRKRSGMRLLTVGTDCALGKKYTALALTRAFRERGVDAHFRATGQTGIMIAGAGIPLDAVVADFIAGAAETLSPANRPDHWDVIEGQGSLFHPAYAGVCLGLLHGSQPDVLVLCHETGRTHVLGLPGYPIVPLSEAIEINLHLARRVNPSVRCAAVSLNTSTLAEHEAKLEVLRVRDELGIPCADPLRTPKEFERMVDACLADPSCANSFTAQK